MRGPTNLRSVRKRLKREKSAQTAHENAAKHGRSKIQTAKEVADIARARSFLDGHKRDP